MRLVEAILKANHAAPAGQERVECGSLPDALPLAVLSCIDTRLNRLLPARLGLPEDQLVWLRNAGNILTGPLSSTSRSLALACAVKGAREIAIVGHSDCQVCKTSVLTLTEALRRLGVDRQRLPDNLVEFFGLFASERQNVMRGVDILRSSPLIGAGVPVHGLLLDLPNGRLEWVVNGYAAQPTSAAPVTSAVTQSKGADLEASVAAASTGGYKTPEIHFGDVKLPEMKIAGVKLPDVTVTNLKLPSLEVSGLKLPELKVGGIRIDPNRWLSQVKSSDAAAAEAVKPEETEATQGGSSPESTFDKARRYKVIGSDQKVYGPINGLKILQWIAEGRIGWDTPSQVEGSNEWRPLSLWSQVVKRLQKSTPPRLPPSSSGAGQ